MRFLPVMVLTLLSSCAYLPQNPEYFGPPLRPPEVRSYYTVPSSYSSYKDTQVGIEDGIEQREIIIETQYGPAELDLFRAEKPNDAIVLVFPILGGSYLFERHFAKYFAERGIDSAIVRRVSEFKDPNRIFEIEELLRQGLIRDRITLTFLEEKYQKSRFGSFGISRGGINVALLAGIDERLKYNVIVLGGTDLPDIVQESDQPGIDKYRRRIEERKGIDSAQFDTILREQIRSDPKHLAKYMDSRNTLMLLAALDATVPFENGMRLRRQIGQPETVVLLANHYTSLFFTQFVHVLLPFRELCLFPFDLVESEAMQFYRKSFGIGGGGGKELLLAMGKAPFDLFHAVRCATDSDCRKTVRTERVKYARVQGQLFARREPGAPTSRRIFARSR